MPQLTLTYQANSETTLHFSFGEAVCYWIECSVRLECDLEMDVKEIEIQW